MADTDLEPLITSPEMLVGVRDAARIARVQPKTVHQWVKRGHLAAAGLDEQGHRLFRALDVAIAEAKLRKAARRPALPPACPGNGTLKCRQVTRPGCYLGLCQRDAGGCSLPLALPAAPACSRPFARACTCAGAATSPASSARPYPLRRRVPSLLTTIQRVPVATVTTYPGNPRRGDLDAIAGSLTANQQYSPLIVQKSTGYVLVGNNTLAAAIKLDWDEIDVTYVDVDDAQAHRILLSSNRTADLASYDDRLLAEALAVADDYDGTGWDEDAADEILRTSGFLAEQATGFLGEYMHQDPGITQGDHPHQDGQPAPGGNGTPGETHPADGSHEQGPAPQPNGTETVYVQVSWLITPGQRATVHQALDAAREKWGLTTNANALVALCSDWLNQQSGDGQ